MTEYLEQEKEINKVVAIPLEYICINPNQPRQILNQDDLLSLMASIKENGLLQPITVRKLSEKCYELIAGERRSRACLALGFKYVPAIIEDVSNQQSAVLALIENVQRKDLNFFEEAKALKNIMELKNINQQELGELLGKTQGSVANKLRLLKLTPRCEQLIISGKLTERHARGILKLSEEKLRIKAINHIIKYNLNVEQSEKYVKKLISKNQSEITVKVNDVKVFQSTLNNAVNFMKSAGFEIISQHQEDDEFINYNIKISKKKNSAS